MPPQMFGAPLEPPPPNEIVYVQKCLEQEDKQCFYSKILLTLILEMMKTTKNQKALSRASWPAPGSHDNVASCSQLLTHCDMHSTARVKNFFL